ncbi:MAG: M56 family metallopeptidase, partial [Oscillospiraceae bacterium]|nr:M56 family metallopeptidase [Oscillospiraceae bacterium]
NLAPIQSVVERNVISTAEAQAQPFVGDARDHTAQASPHAGLLAEEPGVLTNAVTVFMALYLPIAGLVLLYSLFGYARFVKKLRRSSSVPHPSRYDMLAILAGGKRTPGLIISEYAATPMLIGVFRPTIVLPKKAYSNEQLQSILLHELAHMRRFDVLVKWLTLLACAVHWFNPLVWVARREIDRACELSCDETVISGLDTYGKQHYGDTLISVASNKKIPLPVLSTTMCAEKRALKERLSAIMKNKKHTKLTVLISVILFLAVTLTACAVAAGGGTELAPTPEPTPYVADEQNPDPDYEEEPNEAPDPNETEPNEASTPNNVAPAPPASAPSFAVTVAERDAPANAPSLFNVRVVSKTFADTGFGMNDDFGGYTLVFELENTSGRAFTVDLSAVFRWAHGEAAWLIDPQDVYFEAGQTRQFTHAFGAYHLDDPTPLIIEYWNVRS